MGAGCSSDCQLWLEILPEGKGQVDNGAGMRAQEPLLRIRSFDPLFPLCGHPGKSVLPPPVFAKPNTSITCPQPGDRPAPPGNLPVSLWREGDVLRRSSIIARSCSMEKLGLPRLSPVCKERGGQVRGQSLPAVLQGCQPDCFHGERALAFLAVDRRVPGDTHPEQPVGGKTHKAEVSRGGRKGLQELRALAGGCWEGGASALRAGAQHPCCLAS